MKNDKSIYEEIDRYLDNEMSADERMRFEENLERNPNLKAAFERAKNTDKAVHYANLFQLKNEIENDLKTIKYRKYTLVQKTVVALSVLALVSLGTLTANYYIDKEDPSLQVPERTNRANKKTEPELKTIVNKIDSSDLEEFTRKESSPDEVQEQTSSFNQIVVDTSNNKTAITDSVVEETIVPDEDTITKVVENDKQKLSIELGNDSIVPQPVCNETFSISSTPSCITQESGTVTITPQNISLDYEVQLNGEVYTTLDKVTDLGPKRYQIKILYDEGCVYSKAIEIKTEQCYYNDAFSFNTEYGEQWTPKYDGDLSGEYIIYDLNGQTIFTNRIGDDTNIESWNGEDLNGDLAKPGIYYAVINYENGNREKVEITIVE